jgi:hypothetical protein
MKRKMKGLFILFILVGLFISGPALAQKVNEFPDPSDPLHVRVAMFDKLMWGNHYNEGTMMQHVIFPPAGLERPIVGSQEDCADVTCMMLVAYSHKYAVTKDEADREKANQLLAGLLKLEKVTGVPGVMARSFNRTDKPLWHEKVYFFPMEWHWSTSMPGYRWQGDLSSDKFTSLFYALGTYWEYCADQEHKKIAADLFDRFMGRCVDYNFKLVDVDNKMTLWGNFCPDLPHQPLNSLEMLGGLKVAYRMTGKERYRAAYHMLVDRYGYADHAIQAKLLWPDEWKTAPWDDHLAAKSFYMLMRWETDRTLMIKYRMNLNRHWVDWKTAEFNYSAQVWYHMLYQVLTGEEIMTDKTIQAIKNMWGFDRRTAKFKIPTGDYEIIPGAYSRSWGFDEETRRSKVPEGEYKIVESEYEGNAATMIRNYWFGRHYGFIDPEW